MAGPGLSLTQKPRLGMNASLRQTMTVLSLRGRDITSLARSLVDENPFLDIRLPDPVATSRAGADLPVDFDRFGHDTVHPVSLAEHLIGEIGLMIPDPDQRAVAMALVEHVSPVGWLDPEGEGVAARLGMGGEAFDALLARLQQLDPPGIFARSLAECLSLQLERMGVMDDEARCVLDHLDRLTDGGIASLADCTGLAETRVTEVLARLRRCNPKPGSAFSHDEGEIFRPDLIIDHSGNGASDGDGEGKGFVVRINDASLPEVTVKDATPDDEAGELLLRQARSEARMLTTAIRQRSEMLLAAGGMLVQHQADFLRHGEGSIRPLAMSEMADRLNCNKSTVSRLVADKLCQTPRGMISMKDFFATALPQPGGGRVAGRAVAARLMGVIASEPPHSPLSDDDLVAAMAEQGFVVARRTIAKYRHANRVPRWQDRQRVSG